MAPRRDNVHGQNYEVHAPDAGFKGGGFRGGPKRWTGKGPRPARHIPWPEIFRHHLSVVEGHEKMIDMIRKHTVEGSNNWRMINVMLDRCREMTQMTKKAASDFVPPADQLDKIPIGSSSASMYPGYSPADHLYGEAAAEFGRVNTTAPIGSNKLELNPQVDEPENSGDYTRNFRSGPMGSSSNDMGANATPLGMRNAQKEGGSVKAEETANGSQTEAAQDTTTSAETDANPYFVIDTKPTPLNTLVTGRVAPTNEKNDDAVAAASQRDNNAKLYDKTEDDSKPMKGNPGANQVSIAEIHKHGKAEQKSKKSKKRKLDEASHESSQMIPGPVEDQLPKKKKKSKSKQATKELDIVPAQVEGEAKTIDIPPTEASEGSKKKKKKKPKKNNAATNELKDATLKVDHVKAKKSKK